MMYPIKFNNIYKKKTWGNRDLGLFRKNLPMDSNIGETIDVISNDKESSIIENGEFKGRLLRDVLNENKDLILGPELKMKHFPLCIKIISCSNTTPLQIGKENLKKVLYVIDANDNSEIIDGFSKSIKEIDEDSLEFSIIPQYLETLKIKEGDSYFIPGNTVHGIKNKSIIVSIETINENSYTTLKNLDDINIHSKSKECNKLSKSNENVKQTYLHISEDLAVEKLEIYSKVENSENNNRFHIITCVKGQGYLKTVHGIEKVNKGDSILIPANLNNYELLGKFTVLKSYIPDFIKLKDELLKSLF